MAPPTIAVITAHDDIREMMHDLLGLQGFAVRSTCPDDAPLDFVRATAPDLVITDIHPVSINATVNLVRELKHDPAAAQIPVLVGATSPRLLAAPATELAELGVATFSEPFDVDALVTLIHRALAQRSQGPE